jgi:hypothetical protein
MPPNPCPCARPGHRILAPWPLLRPGAAARVRVSVFFFAREEESSGMRVTGPREMMRA